MNAVAEVITKGLKPEEAKKRNDLAARNPYVAGKLAKITEMEEQGQISPIIRLEKSYLCNFQCTHCSAEYYMDRHLKKSFDMEDGRRKLDLEDIRRISKEADELGIARFVITGGEPLVMKDFDEVVEAIDPDKHYVVTDTNGWFLDLSRAKHLKAIGVEKVQLSLDSMIEAEHDVFRNRPGSYKRVMQAVESCLEAGLNLILSTVLVRGRVKKDEFIEMCEFCKSKGIGLYVSYAKPVGSCTNHPEFVITKEDADILRELEKEYPVFTHMTPSYGSFKGCITVKGIITITSTGEITPCPYIDFSLGNIRENSLKEILERGMRNPWIGPHRPDCLIGEDEKFIRVHTRKTRGKVLLPIPWGEGFSDNDNLASERSSNNELITIGRGKRINFDSQGRCLPTAVINGEVNTNTRQYYRLGVTKVDMAKIHSRTRKYLGVRMGRKEFEERIESLKRRLCRDHEIAGIVNGTGIPFIIPKLDEEDMGRMMVRLFLPAVQNAFEESQPGYIFTNHVPDGLEGRLSIRKGSRQDILMSRVAREEVAGIYFPCLSEYSIPAALEQIDVMPEDFMISGGYDSSAAFVSMPEILLRRDGYSPLLWMAGVTDAHKKIDYHYEAYGFNLTFNRRPHLNKCSEYWWCGITILS